MPYCSLCGVEVDKEVKICPLCKKPIQKFYEDDTPHQKYPETESRIPPKPPLNMRERMQLGRVITTFGFLIPFFMTFGVDFIFNRHITWSAYTMGGLIVTWLWIMIPLFFSRPFLMIYGFLISGLGFLFFLDYITPPLVWFFPLGLPLAVMLSIISTIIVFIINRSKKPIGLLLSSLILVGLGVFSVGIDIILSMFKEVKFQGWSLVLLGAMLPITGLLIFLRSREKKEKVKHLKKYFHI